MPKIITEEGFILHPDKTRIMRNGAKKEVTGITVNDKLGVDKKTLKKFRATLHQIETKGAANVHWGQSPNIIASIEGYANFVLMVDRKKGGQLKEKVNSLMPVLLQSHKKAQRKNYPRRIPITEPKPITKEILADENMFEVTKTTQQKKPWWKFWAK